MQFGKDNSIFNRNGFIAVSDFESLEWRQLFNLLETEQSNFSKHEHMFRSPAYRWPRKPLYNFSRCYEYPYVYHHLHKMREAWSGKDIPKVIDFGSGVTFFPFSVAKFGLDVTCVDVDPLLASDLPRAAKVIPVSPGTVSYKLSDGHSIPLADNTIDAVYCISVLEHIPWFSEIIEEIYRILRPGGKLLLTYDVLLKGSDGLSVVERKQLRDKLDICFEPNLKESTVHPLDVLDIFKGPFPNLPIGLKLAVYKSKQWVKPLIGREKNKVNNLTVECYSALKRS